MADQKVIFLLGLLSLGTVGAATVGAAGPGLMRHELDLEEGSTDPHVVGSNGATVQEGWLSSHRTELGKLDTVSLLKEALKYSVDEGKLNEALDPFNMKSAVIDIIMQEMPQKADGVLEELVQWPRQEGDLSDSSRKEKTSGVLARDQTIPKEIPVHLHRVAAAKAKQGIKDAGAEYDKKRKEMWKEENSKMHPISTNNTDQLSQDPGGGHTVVKSSSDNYH